MLETIPNPSTCSKQKVPQLLDFDGFGTVANAKHPWLGYTQSRIQQKQPVEFDGFGTHGYMLYTVAYWIHQNPSKSGKTRRRILEELW